MSVSSQARKLSTSPFSRDVHMTNQKLKSMQQHTENILKLNKKKNMSLVSNLGVKNGIQTNNDTCGSSHLQNVQGKKIHSSSNATSPKLSPREQLPSSLTQQVSNTLNSKMSCNGKISQQNNLTQKNGNNMGSQQIQAHNLSKQAQNSLKQLQKTLHQNSCNSSNKIKSQSQIPGKYTLNQDTQNIRIPTLGNSLKPSEDTPKFKHLKNGDWQNLESIQGLNNFQNISGADEFIHQNNVNVLCSVFSFGHESDEDENGNQEQEKVKRSEPVKPSQFCYTNSSQNGEKKKRVSFCDPTIHTYSADEDLKRFDHYFTEKYPTKNSQTSSSSQTQIPSCLSQKNIQVRLSSPNNSTHQHINQPVSIIKKHDQAQNVQRSNFIIENCQNNQFVNNYSNINSNSKADNNIIEGVLQQQKHQNSTSDQLNNHAIFESFAPKSQQNGNNIHQNHHLQLQKQNQPIQQNNQGNQRYSPNPSSQQNQPNTISMLIQNALKNFNQNQNSQNNIQNRSVSPNNEKTSMNANNISDKNNQMNNIPFKENIQVAKDQSSVPSINIQPDNSITHNLKLEEARKNLVKRESHSISEIISVSPLKRTTSHEYLVCKDQTSNQNDQFSNRSEMVLARLSKQEQEDQNKKNVINNQQKQLGEFTLQDIQNIKIENQLLENTSKSNASSNTNSQKNYSEVSNNNNNNNNNKIFDSDLYQINNYPSSSLINNSPQTSFPQQSSVLSNNYIQNIPTSSPYQSTNQMQQGQTQKENNNIASATSSFISSCSPPYRSYDQTTLAGSSNFANTDIKLSIIQPVNASSFAFGSHITLSPQESISSIQVSQAYNLNTNNNVNQNIRTNSCYNPINNSLNNLSGVNNQYNHLQGNPSSNISLTYYNHNNNSNVIYLSNQKGIQIPTCLSSSSSDANANNNTTANTNNSCANLDLYKVSVPSFDAPDKNRQEKTNQNIIKINLEEITNNSPHISSHKEEQKDINSDNNINNINFICNQLGNGTATSQNTNSNNNNLTGSSPFSIQSNQNFTMTTTSTATALTNNRQSFETNFWRNEAELTPSEYFLSFITNNPKPCPKPCIGGVGTPQANNLIQKKNGINVKDSFMSTQAHFIPKQNMDNNLDSSIEFDQNNFSQSCSYIKHNSKTSLSNTASYGIEQSKVKSKSPNRLNTNFITSLKSSQCSTATQSKKQIQTPQQQQDIKCTNKNKSYSNYASISQNNIPNSDVNPYQQQFQSQYYNTKTSLSPSKRLHQIQLESNTSASNQTQKRPVFLEYNNISSMKKGKNASSTNSNNNNNNHQEIRNKITSQLNQRKTSEQSQVKKDITSFYNIQKITQQNSVQNNNNQLNKKIGMNNNHNHSRDQIIQNYYQIQTNLNEKANLSINSIKNQSQERQPKNSSLI